LKSSLQSKIAHAMWVMTAVSTLAAVALTGGLLISSHRESVRQQLQATASSLVSLGITHFTELKDFEEMNHFIEDALQMDRIDKVIRIYDASGKLIFTTAGADYDKLPESLESKITKPIFRTIEGSQKKRRYDSLIVPYEGVSNNRKFYLQVVIPLPKYSEMLDMLWWQGLLMFGLLIGISIILSQWLSRRLSRPVHDIAMHLKQMDPETIDELKPLEVDEKSVYLKSIVDGINQMADRTRAAILQLRKMSRYVAHEMRTPLTILQGEAEMALLKKDATVQDHEKVLKSSLEEVQRMSEIVNTVLQVGETAHMAPFFQSLDFNINTWLEDNKLGWEKTLERKINLIAYTGHEVEVRADPKLLYRLIDNLIRNVKNHTAYDAVCNIELDNSSGSVSLSVEDSGTGLPENVIESLNAEKGLSRAADIGLNLCYRIAEISDFKLHFSNRKGGGLKVEIRF